MKTNVESYQLTDAKWNNTIKFCLGRDRGLSLISPTQKEP